MKKVAVRTIRLCTKDCLCLYVCPTGASNTENSIIDTEKCIGCGACADACPSGAISMVPQEYPKQQPKAPQVLAAMRRLTDSKAEQEKIALRIAAETSSPELGRLAKAVAKSNRLMAEDLMRESGYMLPQSANARRLLKFLSDNPPSEDFPARAAKKLLEQIPCNE